MAKKKKRPTIVANEIMLTIQLSDRDGEEAFSFRLVARDKVDGKHYALIEKRNPDNKVKLIQAVLSKMSDKWPDYDIKFAVNKAQSEIVGVVG